MPAVGGADGGARSGPNGGSGRRIDLGGFALVVASALCYSFLGILGKVAYRERLPVLSLLATRFTIGACILWIGVGLAPGLRAAWDAMPRRRAAGLLAWGIFGFAGQSALYFAALAFIPASLSEVLLYTCPAFVALILWARTRRRPAPPRLLAVVLALLGTALCAGPLGGGMHLGGAALAVLTGLWYASFLLVLHRLAPGVPGILSGALIVAGAAFAFDIAALLGGYSLPRTPVAWGVVLGMVLSATVLGFVLFVVGLKRVGPQVASILSTFEPLGTLVLAVVLLGERLTSLQWAGAALIIGAAFVLAATEEGEEAIASPIKGEGAGAALRPGAAAVRD